MNCSAKLWFCSFNNALVALRGQLSPEPFLINQWIFKWNKRPVSSSPISPVFSFPHYLKTVIFSEIPSLSDFFLGEEDNSYLNILFFLFHKIINLFDSYYGIGTNRHAVSSRKLMLLSEGIYFLKHFFSCIMFGKLTAKEKIVPRSPQSHSIARTPWNLHRFRQLQSRLTLHLRFPLRFAAAMVCFRMSTGSSWVRHLMVLFEEKP